MRDDGAGDPESTGIETQTLQLYKKTVAHAKESAHRAGDRIKTAQKWQDICNCVGEIRRL